MGQQYAVAIFENMKPHSENRIVGFCSLIFVSILHVIRCPLKAVKIAFGIHADADKLTAALQLQYGWDALPYACLYDKILSGMM